MSDDSDGFVLLLNLAKVNGFCLRIEWDESCNQWEIELNGQGKGEHFYVKKTSNLCSGFNYIVEQHYEWAINGRPPL